MEYIAVCQNFSFLFTFIYICVYVLILFNYLLINTLQKQLIVLTVEKYLYKNKCLIACFVCIYFVSLHYRSRESSYNKHLKF
jgi:hypothetical protein